MYVLKMAWYACEPTHEWRMQTVWKKEYIYIWWIASWVNMVLVKVKQDISAGMPRMSSKNPSRQERFSENLKKTLNSKK